MRFWRRRSSPGGDWQVRTDQPSRLLFALYVRDALGIAQTAAPVGLPRIDPAVGVPTEAAPSEATLLEGAWNRWWTRCVSTKSGPDVDVRSPSFIADEPLAEQIERLRWPAIIWSQAHRDAAHEGIHQQAIRQGPLIRAHMSKGGPSLPFTLRIVVLPVDSHVVWPVESDLVIVPERLFTADGAFDTVLAKLVEALRSP